MCGSGASCSKRSFHEIRIPIGHVVIFLTTDDRLIRAATRASGRLAIRVLNPVSYWEEVKNASARND